MPDLSDLVELIVDVPDKNLRAGMQGTIVHCYADQAYEVEFTDDEGETLDFTALRPEQFIVVWRAKTQQWVSVSEQAAALIAALPDEAREQVLDFARFLAVRMQRVSNGQELLGKAVSQS